MTRNETHVQDSTTLAWFMDWAQSVGNALIAFGWTRTADTGQVNWGTISSPPALNTWVYEIFQSNDGLPTIYVRIDYGNAGGSSSLSAIQITAGTGTNGSGTLTGFVGHTMSMRPGAAHGATLYNCLFCGDAGTFTIHMWRDSGNNCVFGVDRSRNASGATTNAYFTVFSARDASTVNSPYAQQSIIFSGGTLPAGVSTLIAGNGTLYFATIANSAGGSLSVGGVIAVNPVFPVVGYYDYPTLALIQPSQSDFSELATISCTMYGATHTFLFSKNGVCAGAFNLGIAMRWE